MAEAFTYLAIVAEEALLKVLWHFGSGCSELLDKLYRALERMPYIFHRSRDCMIIKL